MAFGASSGLLQVLRSAFPHVGDITSLEVHLSNTGWSIEREGLPELLAHTLEIFPTIRRMDTKFHVLKVMGKPTGNGKIWALLHQSSIRSIYINTIALYDFAATGPIDTEAVSAVVGCQPVIATAPRPNEVEWQQPRGEGEPPKIFVRSTFQTKAMPGACITIGVTDAE